MSELQRLEQIAAAAGHGHGHRGVSRQPDPWFDLNDNVRPTYDLLFIRTFDPPAVRDLVRRLATAEAMVERLAGEIAGEGMTGWADDIRAELAAVRGKEKEHSNG